MPRDDPRGQLVRHTVERAAVDGVSNRDSVGCEARRSPETGSPSSSGLWTGPSATRSPSLAVGLAAGDAEDALADQVRERCRRTP